MARTVVRYLANKGVLLAGDVANRWGLGCGVAVIALGVGLGVAGGVLAMRAAETRALAESAALEEATKMAEPALTNLRQADTEWDVDRTMRVIHAMDGALREGTSLRDYLDRLAGMDLRDVHPAVLKSREQMLDVMLRLYARQTEADARQEMWDTTSEMVLATLSVVKVSGSIGIGDPNGAVSVDREQAQQLLRDWREDREIRSEIVSDIAALEVELLDAVSASAQSQHTVLRAWDELSLVRDRAWLSASAGDWDGALAAARVAIEKAPREREAHLIAAWALIERGDPESLSAVGPLLDAYVSEHPDSSAPALLLTGVAASKRGDSQGARRALEQAAAYFPRQAAALGDLVDPYQQRAWLRQSREGSHIVEQYTATMLGAGFFSPDLHLAQLAFARGDATDGRKKVLDHFARRRAQGQWDFILSDLAFCEKLLGADWREMFPEDAWLDLEVNPPLVGDGLKLAVVNRGALTLHNATLILAVHFTDTFPGDYVGLRVPETAPSLPAGDRTSYGNFVIAVKDGARTRTESDVVEVRAVVVSDEAVLWVDTEPFKVAEAEAFVQQRAARLARESREVAGSPVPPARSLGNDLAARAETLFTDLKGAGTLRVVEGYAFNDVVIELPRLIAFLRPVFRLEQEGQEPMSAAKNAIRDDIIELTFERVKNVDDGAARRPLTLHVLSGWGETRLTWVAEGQSWVRVPTMGPP